MSYVIGFTGTRSGMSLPQMSTVRGLVAALAFEKVSRGQPHAAPAAALFGLHGDCIGADRHFDDICVELGIDRKCWPCTFNGNADHGLRANTQIQTDSRPWAELYAEPTNPAKRNKGIVTAATVMIATPPTAAPVRGGTWMTIEMTRKAKKPLFLVLPDGDLIIEGGA